MAWDLFVWGRGCLVGEASLQGWFCFVNKQCEKLLLQASSPRQDVPLCAEFVCLYNVTVADK